MPFLFTPSRPTKSNWQSKHDHFQPNSFTNPSASLSNRFSNISTISYRPIAMADSNIILECQIVDCCWALAVAPKVMVAYAVYTQNQV